MRGAEGAGPLRLGVEQIHCDDPVALHEVDAAAADAARRRADAQLLGAGVGDIDRSIVIGSPILLETGARALMEVSLRGLRARP